MNGHYWFGGEFCGKNCRLEVIKHPPIHPSIHPYIYHVLFIYWCDAFWDLWGHAAVCGLGMCPWTFVACGSRVLVHREIGMLIGEGWTCKCVWGFLVHGYGLSILDLLSICLSDQVAVRYLLFIFWGGLLGLCRNGCLCACLQIYLHVY